VQQELGGERPRTTSHRDACKDCVGRKLRFREMKTEATETLVSDNENMYKDTFTGSIFSLI